MLKNCERQMVYSNILRNFWNGEYISKACRGLSEKGARRYYRQLESDGILIFKVGKASKKTAVFTKKGISMLKNMKVLDNKLNTLVLKL